MTEQARNPWAALVVLCLGTFAILMDGTIVNVALPSMITGLHASLDQALWIINSYLLVFAALLILASRLGDMLGPRRVFVAGLAAFALSSALCGAAQTPGQLIAARVLQGIGAAAIAPQAMVIIRSLFHGRQMGTAFGVFSSMIGVAAVSGPVTGGLLTTYLSWRWVFYVNLPIAAVGIALSYVFVPEIRTHRKHSLDLVGVLLGAAGLTSLCFGVIEGQRYSWGTVRYGITIAEIIGLGVVLLAGFAAWELRQREPLIPLGLLRSRNFAIVVALSLGVQFALQSMLLVNSINLQSALGFSAIHAGLTGLPTTLAMTSLAPFAGRITDRFGGKHVLAAGLALADLRACAADRRAGHGRDLRAPRHHGNACGPAAPGGRRLRCGEYLAPAGRHARRGSCRRGASQRTGVGPARPRGRCCRGAARCGAAHVRGTLLGGRAGGPGGREGPAERPAACGDSAVAGSAPGSADPRGLRRFLHRGHALGARRPGGDPGHRCPGLPDHAP